MSDVSSNDNAPAEVLEPHIEVAHAVNALAHHERGIKRMVMVPLPNGVQKPLGEILMRLGQALLDKKNEAEERRPRIILPPSILRP